MGKGNFDFFRLARYIKLNWRRQFKALGYLGECAVNVWLNNTLLRASSHKILQNSNIEVASKTYNIELRVNSE